MDKRKEKRTESIFNNFKRTCRRRIHALFSEFLDARPPAMAADWYPVEWISWLHFGPSREFHYGPDSWLSPRNGMNASAGPNNGKLSRAQQFLHGMI
jgi:hypothetical protein